MNYILVNALFLFIIVLFGLSIGSFLNVIIIRGKRKGSLHGRSHCMSCGRTLSVIELIPLASFFLQKGRCRNCKEPISWQYPLVEGGTALLFVVASGLLVPDPFTAGRTLTIILAAALGSAAAIAILVSDFKEHLIPDGATLTLAAVGIYAACDRAFFQGTTSPLSGLTYDVAAAVIIMMFLGSLWFFSGGTWMGFGDVKLIFATSLLVGFPLSIAALLFAFWIGGILGVILLGLGKKTLQARMAFGPFILLGAAAAHLLAPKLFETGGLFLLFPRIL